LNTEETGATPLREKHPSLRHIDIEVN